MDLAMSMTFVHLNCVLIFVFRSRCFYFCVDFSASSSCPFRSLCHNKTHFQVPTPEAPGDNKQKRGNFFDVFDVFKHFL